MFEDIVYKESFSYILVFDLIYIISWDTGKSSIFNFTTIENVNIQSQSFNVVKGEKFDHFQWKYNQIIEEIVNAGFKNQATLNALERSGFLIDGKWNKPLLKSLPYDQLEDILYFLK
jgi:hypothetical protein